MCKEFSDVSSLCGSGAKNCYPALHRKEASFITISAVRCKGSAFFKHSSLYTTALSASLPTLLFQQTMWVPVIRRVRQSIITHSHAASLLLGNCKRNLNPMWENLRFNQLKSRSSTLLRGFMFSKLNSRILITGI